VISLSSGSGPLDPKKYKRPKKRFSTAKKIQNSSRKKIMKNHDKPSKARKWEKSSGRRVKAINKKDVTPVDNTPSVRSSREPDKQPPPPKQPKSKKTMVIEMSIDRSHDQPSEREFLKGLERAVQ